MTAGRQNGNAAASENLHAGESVPVDNIQVSAYCIPTESPESDGTLAWNHTILVLVEIAAGGKTGLGYTYAGTATARLVQDQLQHVVEGRNALDVTGSWAAMVKAIRNLGRPGIASMAIAAVDTALWDLKARLLNVSLTELFGTVREGLPVYGSGGFTSYSDEQLSQQLGGWSQQGIPRVKMKVGRDATKDIERVRIAREAIGPETELFVDANGGYTRKQALKQAQLFASYGITWFEEPVSSDDLEGLQLMRNQGPPGMDIAAGEYGYDLTYFRRMLQANCVDVLQADATRCGGFTGFLKTAALCEAFHVPLSAHCAPALHLHVGCAALPVCHAEYFSDHVRIENMLFDGVAMPVKGVLYPDRSSPGMGLVFRKKDAQPYAVSF